jgi:alpha-beta hydrolase superfamily lysophospholipase
MMISLPFTSETVTRDPDYLAVMNASPDEIRAASLKCLFNVLLEQTGSGKLAQKLSVPTLFLIPGVDLVIDERAGRKMFRKLPLADKTLLEYPDMLHALSIDLGREKVFKDILDWIAPRV